MKWLIEKIAAIIAIFTAGYERRMREDAELEAKITRDAHEIANRPLNDTQSIAERMRQGKL